MSEPKPKASETRTYVAVYNKTNFDGYYCRKFVLPEKDTNHWDVTRDLENSASSASWYFLNRLDFIACVQMVMAVEDYENLKEVC